MCEPYTSDKALRYSCICNMSDGSHLDSIARNNSHDKNQLFVSNCNEEKETGAVPFTNKAYYICWSTRSVILEPC